MIMIKRIQIPDILQPVSHYCHVVEANNIIWISGLVGMNYDNSIPENTKDQFDLSVTVKGGGINGQAEAIRLAISRALCEIDEEFKGLLKKEGLMTRDPRMVERKKFGQKKARKKFQFSKR